MPPADRMTTNTTDSREPRTEAGQTFLEEYPHLRQLVYGTTGQPIVVAIEEQAAAEARRELLAKVEVVLATAERMEAMADEEPRRLVEVSKLTFGDLIVEPLRRLIEGSR